MFPSAFRRAGHHPRAGRVSRAPPAGCATGAARKAAAGKAAPPREPGRRPGGPGRGDGKPAGCRPAALPIPRVPPSLCRAPPDPARDYRIGGARPCPLLRPAAPRAAASPGRAEGAGDPRGTCPRFGRLPTAPAGARPSPRRLSAKPRGKWNPWTRTSHGRLSPVPSSPRRCCMAPRASSSIATRRGTRTKTQPGAGALDLPAPARPERCRRDGVDRAGAVGVMGWQLSPQRDVP